MPLAYPIAESHTAYIQIGLCERLRLMPPSRLCPMWLTSVALSLSFALLSPFLIHPPSSSSTYTSSSYFFLLLLLLYVFYIHTSISIRRSTPPYAGSDSGGRLTGWLCLSTAGWPLLPPLDSRRQPASQAQVASQQFTWRYLPATSLSSLTSLRATGSVRAKSRLRAQPHHAIVVLEPIHIPTSH